MKRSRAVGTLLPIFLLTAGALDAQTAARPAPKLTRMAPAVVLPFYRVDTTDPEGVTTFFAVRNRGAAPVTVRFGYHAPASGLFEPVVTRVRELGPRALAQIDVRSIAGLPTDADGLATGYMVAQVIDPAAGLPEFDSAVLGGDFFRVDDRNDFASGGALLAVGPQNGAVDLCRSWDVRFFNGGGFNGGTVMTFFVTSDADADAPLVTGRIYNQAGEFQGMVELDRGGDRAFEVRSLDLAELDGIPFGVVEWTFADGVVGHVTATFDALEQFSVGLPAVCADERAAPDPMVVTAQVGEIVATLASTPQVLVAQAVLIPILGTFDPDTGYWTLELDLGMGRSAVLQVRFLDAMGTPQQNFDPASTTTVELRGELDTVDGSLDFETVLDGVEVGSPSFTANGGGTANLQGETISLTIDGVVIPRGIGGAGDPPTSGTITAAGDGFSVEVTFDGTTEVAGTYTFGGQVGTFTLDLETGEVSTP